MSEYNIVCPMCGKVIAYYDFQIGGYVYLDDYNVENHICSSCQNIMNQQENIIKDNMLENQECY